MRCQECHSPSQIDSGCFWGQRRPYLVSDRLKPATGLWAALSQGKLAQGRGDHETVKPDSRRQQERRDYSLCLHTRCMVPTTDPCLAWSFFTLQASAPRPQPQEGFPKPTIPKGALPTAQCPCLLTVSFSSLFLRQHHLPRLVSNSQSVLTAGTTGMYQCTQIVFLLVLVFVR